MCRIVYVRLHCACVAKAQHGWELCQVVLILLLCMVVTPPPVLQGHEMHQPPCPSVLRLFVLAEMAQLLTCWMSNASRGQFYCCICFGQEDWAGRQQVKANHWASFALCTLNVLLYPPALRVLGTWVGLGPAGGIACGISGPA
jgi:hypothetical protein